MTKLKWASISSIIFITGAFLLFQAFWSEWYLVQQSFHWIIIKIIAGIALILFGISLKLKRHKITWVIALAYGAFLLFETLYTPFGEYILHTFGHFLAKVIGGVVLICWGIIFFITRR